MLANRATPPLLAAVLLFAANPAIRPHASEPAPPPAHRCRHVLGSLEALPPFPPALTHGVIAPPADFADARPWPRGMVIHPPDTHDRMVAGPDVLAALLAPLIGLL